MVIEAKHIHKSFGKTKALHDISLTFPQSGSVALLGPNASGKTTFIKCILGMVLPDSGDIFFDQVNIKNEHLYRKRIGYMPQIGRYPDNMNIGQLFEMILDLRKTTLQHADSDLIKAFAMESLFHKRIATLSGGTKQKVSACLALLFHPDVIILDEPTAGLDPLSAEILKEKIVAEKNKGKLIIITTHILSELDDLISGVVFFRDGSLLFHHHVSELLEQTGQKTISKAITFKLKHE